MAKVISLTQLQNFADGFTAANDARFIKKADLEIVKQTTAETGYAASYKLMDGATQLGATINIPKDYVVKAATVETCTTADTPVSGLVPGDKYIDLTVNTVDSSETATHLYIAIKDMVSAYSAGNGIDISSSNVVSAKVAASGANGLSVDSDGLKLGLATASVSGVGGSAGAMSATDKEKLDAALTYSGTAPISVSNTGVISIADATQSASGAMSAADKTKLDGITEATDAEITTIINSLYATAGE